jgi:hypothetical protein
VGIKNPFQILVLVGLALALVGVVLSGIGRLPFLGRLPGDILIQRERFTFYAPLGTCLLLSVIFSLILWFLGRR